MPEDVQIINESNPEMGSATVAPEALQNAPGLNRGTVLIEQTRAIAEAQVKLQVAKGSPRDENLALGRLVATCSRPDFAETAMYNFPRAGQNINGPSIRFAEEAARCYGNLEFGMRELAAVEDKTEMQAFAWDLETNVISVQNFAVQHIRETRQGNRVLTSARDIYELNSNQASRRVRSRILAILPPWYISAGIEKVRATLAGDTDQPLEDRIRSMVLRFDRLGVNVKLLEKYLKHSLDETLPEEMADLFAIYQSIKDRTATPADYFSVNRAGNMTPEASDANAKLLGNKGEESESEQSPTEESGQAAPQDNIGDDII